MPDDVRLILSGALPKCARSLISLTKHKNPMIRLKAILAVFDRICGKPIETMELSGPQGGEIPMPASYPTPATLTDLRSMLSRELSALHLPENGNGEAKQDEAKDNGNGHAEGS